MLSTLTRGIGNGIKSLSKFLPIRDVLENKGNYLVEIELPGVKKEEITLDCDGGVLDITAEKKAKDPEGYERIIKERTFGTASVSYQLPANIDTTAISATLNDGILTVSIPKKETAKVDIKVA